MDKIIKDIKYVFVYYGRPNIKIHKEHYSHTIIFKDKSHKILMLLYSELAGRFMYSIDWGQCNYYYTPLEFLKKYL